MQRNSEICLDGITEHIVLNTFDSYEGLYRHVLDIIQRVIELTFSLTQRVLKIFPTEP